MLPPRPRCSFDGILEITSSAPACESNQLASGSSGSLTLLAAPKASQWPISLFFPRLLIHEEQLCAEVGLLEVNED